MIEPDDTLKDVVVDSRLPDEVLRRIAMDYVDGRLFTNFHIDRTVHGESMIECVFMPLLFGAETFVADAWMIYEYRDKAGPICINGCPTFFSMCKISAKDAPVFRHYVNEYRDAKNKFFYSSIPEMIPPETEKL